MNETTESELQSSLSKQKSYKATQSQHIMETDSKKPGMEAGGNTNKFNITAADVSLYEWESVVANADRPICVEYQYLLFQKADVLLKAGDTKGHTVYRFLGQVTSMMLREEGDDLPFAPYVILQCSRSMALEDLQPSDLDTLAGLLPTTSSTAMRARFADILWVTRKHHTMAKIAAESYLENFKKLDVSTDWPHDFESFRRGFELAKILGKKNEPFPSYVAFSENVLNSRAKTEDQALCARLMELLLDHDEGDKKGLASSAEFIAAAIERKGNFFLAQQYLDLAQRFNIVAKDEEGARTSRLKKGECLVRQARSAIQNPGQGYGTGVHFLAMGIESLRQAHAPADTTAALHKELLEWQKLSVKEMRTFSHATDIADVIEASKKYVGSKGLQEAVLAFAMGYPLINLLKHREKVLENAKNYPLSHIFGKVFLSRDGRVMAEKPSVLSSGANPNEEGLESEMLMLARNIEWPFRVRAYIEPCREQIYQEHWPSARELAFLVDSNPFIPPGHENLFLRGLHAGFRGDMMLCAHLLVPQLEEAIRHVLKTSGVITSKLDSKLVQEERLLGTLLAMPQTRQVFGEECVFELRGIFCEKFGFDLRNRLAHGFITFHDCFGDDVFVAWWLILRLCAIPVYGTLEKPAGSERGE